MSTNESLPKNDLINRLKEINALYLNALNIKLKMDDFEPEDTYIRNVVVPSFPGEGEAKAFEDAIDHSEGNAIEKMSRLYKSHYYPEKPAEPKINPFKEPKDVELSKKQAVNSLVSKIAIVIAALFILGNLQNIFDGGFILSEALFTLGVPIVGIFLFFYFKKRSNAVKAEIQKNYDKALEEYNKEKDTVQQQYDNELKDFEEKCQNYEIKHNDFLNAYSEWRKIYIQHLNEEAEIEEKLEADRVAAVNKLAEEEYAPAVEKLFENNDLIANEYLPSLETITHLLASNRADNLKEALNLFEDIMYRERQLELQREQENQRIYEEELHRKDEERRYQEEKEFREQQEWNRRQEELERQRQAERHYREEKEFRERQEQSRQQEERGRQRLEERRYRDEEKARAEQRRQQDRATQRQCNTCALVGHCSVAFTRPNCASFRPR